VRFISPDWAGATVSAIQILLLVEPWVLAG
jgi:hypothetical protein